MKIILQPNQAHLQRMREIGPTLRAGLSMADPSLLRALGVVHRRQEARIFASEGAEGAGGPWTPLDPGYAERKAKAAGSRKKILQLSGDMKTALTKRGDPRYVEQFIPKGNLGLFRFGAHSDVANAHLHGNPALAPQQSAVAKKVFGGRAPRLPVRDPITKTPAMLAEMREALRVWYVARLKAAVLARARLGVH